MRTVDIQQYIDSAEEAMKAEHRSNSRYVITSGLGPRSAFILAEIDDSTI